MRIIPPLLASESEHRVAYAPKRRKDFWQDSRYATRYANSVESTTSDLNDVVASTSICRDWLGVQPRQDRFPCLAIPLLVCGLGPIPSFCKLYSEEKELLWPDSLFPFQGKPSRLVARTK